MYFVNEVSLVVYKNKLFVLFIFKRWLFSFFDVFVFVCEYGCYNIFFGKKKKLFMFVNVGFFKIFVYYECCCKMDKFSMFLEK